MASHTCPVMRCWRLNATYMSLFNSSCEYTVPMSRPSHLSKRRLMGNVTGAKMILRTYHKPILLQRWEHGFGLSHSSMSRSRGTKEQAMASHAKQEERPHMKSLTSHMQRAPTSSPCRVQMLWGMICARGQELWHSFKALVSLNIPDPWQAQLSLQFARSAGVADLPKDYNDEGAGRQANCSSGEICQEDGQSAVCQGVPQQKGAQQKVAPLSHGQNGLGKLPLLWIAPLNQNLHSTMTTRQTTTLQPIRLSHQPLQPITASPWVLRESHPKANVI